MPRGPGKPQGKSYLRQHGFVDYIIDFYRLTALAALLFALAVTWGLAALIVSALRGSWGLLGAGVAAWAAVATASGVMGYSDLAAGTALALALAALRAEGARPRLVLLSLLGALAGSLLLVKFNDGLVSVGLLAVSAVSTRSGRLRASLAPGLPLVGVALVAWVAAGQSIRNLASYVRGSLSVATGYGAAMAISGRRGEEA